MADQGVVTTKRCPRCGIERSDFRTRQNRGRPGLAAYCLECEREYKREWARSEKGRAAQRRHARARYHRMREDPEKLKAYRDRERERSARRYAANPEKFAEASRRWRRRVKANPEREAERLANRRIYHRLVHERETGTLAVAYQFTGAAGAFAPPPHIGAKLPLLDVGPLRQWLLQRFSADWTHAEIAAMTGLDEAGVRRIRRGEVRRISLHTADRVFVNVGAPHLLSVLYPLEEAAA